jgi:hypothetical protein
MGGCSSATVFIFGFFPGGWQTLAQALDAHTDLARDEDRYRILSVT